MYSWETIITCGVKFSTENSLGIITESVLYTVNNYQMSSVYT